MLFPLLTILFVIPLVMGQFDGSLGQFGGSSRQFGGSLGQFGRRPGNCPPYPDVGICDMTCYVDLQCEGSQKCCRTACGGTFCINAVTSSIERIREKPGSCPNPPTGPWVCSSRCGQDSDCRGTKKCCRNRCGAKACVTSEEDLENEIE